MTGGLQGHFGPAHGLKGGQVALGASPEAVAKADYHSVAAETFPLATPFSAVNLDFEGIGHTGHLPADANGDVGPNHYVQAVNAHMQIFDKAGTAITGSLPIRSLWNAAGDTGPCTQNPRGDPVVLYDHLVDRWVISQFARLAVVSSFACVAVSRSPDPTSGGWFLYTLGVATGFDYPKIGVWPDGYYMSAFSNPSGALSRPEAVDAYVLDRAAMLEGKPTRVQRFVVPGPILFVLPGDLDGPPPPIGTPNVLARQVDGGRWGGKDRIELFALSIDWANSPVSRLDALPPVRVEPFDADLCGGTSRLSAFCVPQPATSHRLDTLPNYPMMALQHRSSGRFDTLVFNHTVDVGDDRAGIRWYELRRPAGGGGWWVRQQGTHGPQDDVQRWMGSIAMNGQGDMALGYSVASESLQPGIRTAGRLAVDPLGTLPRGETTIVDGASSQESPRGVTTRRCGSTRSTIAPSGTPTSTCQPAESGALGSQYSNLRPAAHLICQFLTPPTDSSLNPSCRPTRPATGGHVDSPH